MTKCEDCDNYKPKGKTNVHRLRMLKIMRIKINDTLNTIQPDDMVRFCGEEDEFDCAICPIEDKHGSCALIDIGNELEDIKGKLDEEIRGIVNE